MMVMEGSGGFVAGAARTLDGRGLRDVEGWSATSQETVGLVASPKSG